MSHNVSVQVSAESSQFSAGLAKIQNSLDEFKHHTSEQFNELGTELAEAFALTAVVEGVKALFEQFSQVQDQAEKLGTSAEALQKMGVVAKSAGVDTEQLVKTLQKGTKNAVDAVAGNTELSEAFEKLGVDAKEFVNLAPEQQLLELSEGYEKSGQNAETLNAILKALGKSGADIIPILRKGPEALKEEMDAAHVASNETVATIKEVTEKFEKLFGNLKAYGADALDWIIKRTEALGTGFAAITAYVTALPHGLKAAAEAYDQVLDAAAELQVEEENKRQAEEQKRKPVDVDALENAKKDAEEKRKAEEELAKLKEENAKKEEDARFRNLELIQKQLDLESRINDLKNATPASELEAEQNKGNILDLEKELEGVNKEIARDKERDEKKLQEDIKKYDAERARDNLRQKKEALKDAQKTESELEKARKGFTVDSLRQIGGGLRGINYNANAAKDDLQRQQLDYARQQVDKLQQVVDALESQQDAIPQYDGSFN